MSDESAQKWAAKFDENGFDTTLLDGKCIVCGEYLDFYQTKMVNQETKQVACIRHPEVRAGGTMPGFRRYSDG